MNENEFKKLLTDAFNNNDLGNLLSESAETKFFNLYNLLTEYNKITNLTAITDESGVVLKHFVDSATICNRIPANSTVIDVGCGAGFPCIPLAILREDLRITALDSTGKKIDYVKLVVDHLKLTNVEAICCRAEDYVTNHREVFDICTSRAVARLNILDELCLPFVKVGGHFIAMKSNKAPEEYSEASSGIKKLGGDYLESKHISLTLNNSTIEREIYCFVKTSNTPVEFPRKYAQILKKPL